MTAPEERELDPLKDMVRTLNGQADFHGRYRPPPGGSVSVKPEETIAMGGCWCGQEHGHDWPGRDIGFPHPRYPR